MVFLKRGLCWWSWLLWKFYSGGIFSWQPAASHTVHLTLQVSRLSDSGSRPQLTVWPRQHAGATETKRGRKQVFLLSPRKISKTLLISILFAALNWPPRLCSSVTHLFKLLLFSFRTHLRHRSCFQQQISSVESSSKFVWWSELRLSLLLLCVSIFLTGNC